MEPLRSSKVQLVSPAMSSNPNFAQWLTDFKKACTGCHVDVWSVHCAYSALDLLTAQTTIRKVARSPLDCSSSRSTLLLFERSSARTPSCG